MSDPAERRRWADLVRNIAIPAAVALSAGSMGIQVLGGEDPAGLTEPDVVRIVVEAIDAERAAATPIGESRADFLLRVANERADCIADGLVAGVIRREAEQACGLRALLEIAERGVE